jgi:MipA family protein
MARMNPALKAAAACLLAWAGTVARAQEAPAASPAESTGAEPAVTHAVTPETGSPPPAPERRWRLGAALGYGERTNPLIQSDDIPVLVDLDIAYFGDRWFFDNGDLGIELLDNDVMTTNLVARVNSDRAFFSKTNTKYVTYSVMAGGFTAPISNSATGQPITQTEALPLRPPRRSYAIELGFETLFSGEWGQASLHGFHDVSNTHDGFEIGANYSYRITRGRLSLSPSLGLTWKSDQLSDYYWGVHAKESSETLKPYEARNGLSWETGLRANYYLTKSVRAALSANYEHLQHSVAMSPLVKRGYVAGYFAGLAWQF